MRWKYANVEEEDRGFGESGGSTEEDRSKEVVLIQLEGVVKSFVGYRQAGNVEKAC